MSSFFGLTEYYCGTCRYEGPAPCEQHSGLVWTTLTQEKVPHRCPVCDGRGTVPPKFYGRPDPSTTTAAATREMCHACSGVGLLWAP